MTTHEYSIENVDIISDIHGCKKQLDELVEKLGYEKNNYNHFAHPEKRKLVIAGDVTDRGPDSVGCIEFLLNQCIFGPHMYVLGNHCKNLERFLQDSSSYAPHTLKKTVSELREAYTESFLEYLAELLSIQPTRLSFGGGSLLVAHACPPSDNPEDHIFGPRSNTHNRVKWWRTYSDDSYCVFGHYWYDDPEPRDKWCCVDTSCCDGGMLTALRWPTKEIVQIDG